MSNIVGEGFDEIIIKQIDQRQKIYGSVNRTNEQLSYLEARTGWVKLVSSVDLIDNNIRGGFGVGGTSPYTAQKNVGRAGGIIGAVGGGLMRLWGKGN